MRPRAEDTHIPVAAESPYADSSDKRAACRLHDLPDGVRACVRELRGCRHLRTRLYALGLTPGAEVTVRCHGNAGCRVEVRDTCVVLDRESADSVLCDAPGA